MNSKCEKFKELTQLETETISGGTQVVAAIVYGVGVATCFACVGAALYFSGPVGASACFAQLSEPLLYCTTGMAIALFS